MVSKTALDSSMRLAKQEKGPQGSTELAEKSDGSARVSQFGQRKSENVDLSRDGTAW